MRDIGDLRQRIDRARVDVAGLSADDPRPVMTRERLAQGRRPYPTLRVSGYRHDRRNTKPEQPQRAVDGDVALCADEDANRGRADQPLLVDVPTHTSQKLCSEPQQPVTCAI